MTLSRTFLIRVSLSSLWRCSRLVALLGAFSVSLIGCAGTDGDGDGDEGGVACVATADATDAWAQFEEEVVTRTNDARAAGATCGANGAFPPVGPVSLEERLRCAARQHSGAMGEDGFFAHDNPNTGTSPFDRIDAEGYAYSAAGENIAAGYGSPEEVVQGWLDSDGHCANLMSGAYVEIGVGYAHVEDSEYGRYWTQVFASPLGGD